jgi:GNAT superfamily N-acetyltransferase
MMVRWARQQDAVPIAEVHVASWLGGYRGIVPDHVLDRLSVEARAARWAGWLGDPARGSRTLVAGRERRVEGFCSVAMPARGAAGVGSSVAEITAFYVAPAAWRHGVGAALMRRALSEIEAAGLNGAIAWVLERNERAIAFYGALGWSRDGARDRWSPPDHPEVRLPVVRLRIAAVR